MLYITPSRLVVLTALLLTLASIMIACGSSSSQSHTNGNTNMPASTLTATSTIQAQSAVPTPPTITPGQVKLIVSRAHYGQNEKIVVSIANGLSRDIFVSPYYTSCTLVLLERESSNAWIPQGRCLNEQTAHSSVVKAGSITQQRLTPGSGPLKSTTNALWQPGTYRVVLTYSTTSPDPDSYNPQGITVQSGTFMIE